MPVTAMLLAVQDDVGRNDKDENDEKKKKKRKNSISEFLYPAHEDRRYMTLLTLHDHWDRIRKSLAKKSEWPRLYMCYTQAGLRTKENNNDDENGTQKVIEQQRFILLDSVMLTHDFARVLILFRLFPLHLFTTIYLVTPKQRLD